jgi:excinuclease ABC subunit A
MDLGPGGGENGGLIVAQGTPEELKQNPGSVTGPFLEL